MPVTLDTTVGGASANSYVTRAEADDRAAITAWEADWLALTDAEKDGLLVRATLYLDAVPWRGRPAEDAQALQFPRTDVYRPSGTAYPTDEIPELVKSAEAHVAVWLSKDLTVDPFEVAASARLRAEKLDVIEKEYFESATRVTDGMMFVAQSVIPWFKNTGLLGPSGSVQLVR